MAICSPNHAAVFPLLTLDDSPPQSFVRHLALQVGCAPAVHVA
jgi:hypothetical protein